MKAIVISFFGKKKLNLTLTYSRLPVLPFSNLREITQAHIPQDLNLCKEFYLCCLIVNVECLLRLHWWALGMMGTRSWCRFIIQWSGFSCSSSSTTYPDMFSTSLPGFQIPNSNHLVTSYFSFKPTNKQYHIYFLFLQFLLSWLRFCSPFGEARFYI